MFGCHNLKGIKYLTSLQLGLSHLYEHEIKITSKISNLLCTCGCDVENACHFLPHWPNSSLKETLLNKITEITNILNQADAAVTKTLPFGNLKYFGEVNLQILNVIIDFTLTSKRFDEPHLNF